MKKFGLLLLTISFIPNAHAYVDPGTGSFMLQMLIASLLGAGLTLKMTFKNIKDKVISLFSRQPLPETDPSQQDGQDK